MYILLSKYILYETRAALEYDANEKLNAEATVKRKDIDYPLVTDSSRD